MSTVHYIINRHVYKLDDGLYTHIIVASNIAEIFLAVVLTILAVVLGGCASLPIDRVSLCGDLGHGKPPVSLNVDLSQREAAALESGEEVRVALRLGVGSGCTGSSTVSLESAAASAICSSEDSSCIWPAPAPSLEAADPTCYDPWAGRCHPWEEAVRLGISSPGAPFATVALHDPRLSDCWRSAVGRAPADPGPLLGRATGPCGAEWESWWWKQGLPALATAGTLDPRTGRPLNLCGPATREQALMATWDCTQACTARILAEPGGLGLTPEHPFPMPGPGPSGVQRLSGTWGCDLWVVYAQTTPPPDQEPPTPPTTEPPTTAPIPATCACDPSAVADALYRRLTDASRPGRQAILTATQATLVACQSPIPATVDVDGLARALALLLPTPTCPTPTCPTPVCPTPICPPNTDTPDPDPKDPNSLTLHIPGVAHVSSPGAQGRELTLKVPTPITARTIHASLDVVPGPWAPDSTGPHQLLYLYLGRFRSGTVFNVQSRGPNKSSVSAMTNLGGPTGFAASTSHKLLLTRGTRYHIDALYTSNAGFDVTVTNTDTNTSIHLSKSNAKPLTIPASGVNIRLGGNDSEPTPGWSYENLRVEVVP